MSTRNTKVILALLCLTTAIVIVLVTSAGAGAEDPMTLVSGPDWVYDTENVTLVYEYDVTVYGHTAADIDESGIVWDTASHGEFPAYNQFTCRTVAVEGLEGFEADFAPPAGPVTLYYHAYVLIDTTHYLSHQRTLEVRLSPKVRFGGMMGVGLVGHEHETRWYIDNADASEIEETAVYWGTESFWGQEPDKADYPFHTELLSGVLHNPFYANITLPDEPSGVHMLYYARINGRDFYDPLQRSVSVIPLPEFNMSLVPATGQPGSTVNVTWMIPNTAGNHVQVTSLHWDNVSHSGSLDKTLYASYSDNLPGDNSRTYGWDITLPDDMGPIYLMAYCMVFGEEFYSEEVTLLVSLTPTIVVGDHVEVALEGTTVTLEWWVQEVTYDLVTSTALYWDTASHGPAVDKALYPNVVDVASIQEDGHYQVDVVMPDGPVMLYFVVNVVVMGADHYSGEGSMEVLDSPAIAVDDHVESAFEGSEVTIGWTITGVPHDVVTSTTLYWDSSSHAGAIDKASYPNMVQIDTIEEDGHYEVSVVMPDGEGVLYFVVNTVVLGEDIYAPDEGYVNVRVIPTIEVLEVPDKAYVGTEVTVRWTLTGLVANEQFDTSVRWDTTSHSDAMYLLAYSHSAGTLIGNNTGPFSLNLTMPAQAGTVYLIAHARLMDTDFITDQESSIRVMDLPTITISDPPQKAKADKDLVLVVETFGMQPSEANPCKIWWSDGKGNPVPEYFGLPWRGWEDLGNDSIQVTFDVPGSKGEHSFVISCDVDGMNVTSSAVSVTLEKEEKESPGFGTALGVVALATVASLAVGARRRR
jgi:hypothetical protein